MATSWRHEKRDIFVPHLLKERRLSRYYFRGFFDLRNFSRYFFRREKQARKLL
jgi:hypothetical protein